MLYLGLIVLRAQPHVGVVVHPLWLVGERLHHVRTTPEARPDLLRPSESTGVLVLALALVSEVVAVTAREILPRPVQDRHPPTAPIPGADEPGALSPEVARRPLQGHRLPYVLPLGA